MIEGVRALPWMGAAGRLKNRKYDCETCIGGIPEKYRAGMKCGFIPTERWLPPEQREQTFGAFDGCDYIPDVCPGYTTKLPAALEIARIWGWSRDGILSENLEARDMVLTRYALDLRDVFAGEQAAVERYEMEQANKGKG